MQNNYFRPIGDRVEYADIKLPKKFQLSWWFGRPPQETPQPFIMQEENFSVKRIHYTQNDQLDLTVSIKKSVLKNMHRILRYLSKCIKI